MSSKELRVGGISGENLLQHSRAGVKPAIDIKLLVMAI